MPPGIVSLSFCGCFVILKPKGNAGSIYEIEKVNSFAKWWLLGVRKDIMMLTTRPKMMVSKYYKVWSYPVG